MLLGFDIGGTKCAVITAEWTDGKITILKKERTPTDLSVVPEEMLNRLMALADGMLDEKPEAIGISCGGPLDSARGIILGPPNLPGWDHVEIVDEAISEKALTLREGIDSYTEQAFKMYGGQQVDVVLEFDDKLIGVEYDKFGEDTKMIRAGDKCIATVKVQISPVFWGWLFQFAGQMKVLSPDTVIADYKEHAAMLDE